MWQQKKAYETNLLSSDTCPRANYLTDKISTVTIHIAKDVEQDTQPTLALGTQERNVGSSFFSGNGVNIGVLDSGGSYRDVRFHQNLECPENRGSKLWLAIEDLRE
jgi:hypothetical protein